MVKLITKVVGAVFALCGTFLFFIVTVDMSSDLRIAGPMNMWPPPLWAYIIADAIFALLTILGMKLMRWKRISAGYLMSIIGCLLLISAVINQFNAPPRDGISDGRYAPADIESYLAAYIIAASVLFVGLWFIIQHVRKQRLR
jgi:hypothetical protein